MDQLEKKIYGSLLGGMIGDAMGAPCEDLTYEEIEKKFGWVSDFDGAGTDDSAIKQILCNAIVRHEGDVTADEWAEAFLEAREYYNLFFIPVKNMFHKLDSQLELPVYCGMGNMQSSSSAMSIAPIGLINPCNPYVASYQAYDAAGLIHAGATTFCRDGATVIAAAVAEAMRPGISPKEAVKVAVSTLHPKSSWVLLEKIEAALQCLEETGGDYRKFREKYYKDFLQDIVSDSRETVPCVLALFILSEGVPQTAIEYAANFGRDADTIGAMVGSIAGAYSGVDGFPKEWVRKVEAKFDTVQHISKESQVSGVKVIDQRKLSQKLASIAAARYERLFDSYDSFLRLRRD